MSQDISPEVLQRELVEATQQFTIAESTRNRAETELRNATANLDAAQAKVDDLQVRYDAARGVTPLEDVRAKRGTASILAGEPAAYPTADEPPSL